MMKLILATLALILLPGAQDSDRGPKTGGLVAIVAYDGPPQAPGLLEPFTEEGASLDESLLLTRTGELANVIAIAKAPGGPKWKSGDVSVLIANNRAGPRIVFISPGTTVEFKNAHDFTANFISDFGAFRIPAGGTWSRLIEGPGAEDPPLRWYSG